MTNPRRAPIAGSQLIYSAGPGPGCLGGIDHVGVNRRKIGSPSHPCLVRDRMPRTALLGSRLPKARALPTTPLPGGFVVRDHWCSRSRPAGGEPTDTAMTEPRPSERRARHPGVDPDSPERGSCDVMARRDEGPSHLSLAAARSLERTLGPAQPRARPAGGSGPATDALRRGAET